MLTLEIIAAIR